MKFEIKPGQEIDANHIEALVPRITEGENGKPAYGTAIRYIDGTQVFVEDMSTEEVHAKITAIKDSFR